MAGCLRRPDEWLPCQSVYDYGRRQECEET